MAAMAAERGGGSTTANGNNMNISSNNSGGSGGAGGVVGAGGNNGGRSLHNFCLPPCLSWGTQKLLRCSNSTSSLNDVVSQNVSSKRPRHSSPQYGGGGGIDVMREKLMLDLRCEVDKMRAAFLAPPPPPPPRWNLRTRRAVCDDRSPAAVVDEREAEEVVKTAAAVAVAVAVEERGDGGGVSVAPRAKFSVALTRQEVEEDFVAMVGRRPPRKPKKRPRYIHKELETIFPGVWLTEVTADMYKVNETPEAPK